MVERESNGQYKKKYLTIDRFEKFLSNDFWHAKQYAKWSFWVSLTILATIIARYVIG